MSKIVIICESYPQIENALCIIKCAYPDSSITIVIPGNHDLFKFFQMINEKVFHSTINLIYFDRYHPRRLKNSGFRKIFYILPDILEERRYLKKIFDKHFAELKGCEVFFFGRGFSSYVFYLVKKLSQRNKIIYFPDSSYMVSKSKYVPVKYSPTNISDLIGLIILKLTYGWDIAMGKLPHTNGFSFMSDNFMKKKVSRIIEGEERNELMKDLDLSRFKIFDVANYSIIYFDENLIECGYVDKDIFRAELNRIFSILNKYFPEKEIARKYHPCYPGDKTIIKVGDILPDFIPAEWLYNENVKVYLGIYSTSIANVEKGMVISIIDLITFKNDEIKTRLKEVLIQRSKSKILFPSSLDEFEKILAKVARQDWKRSKEVLH